LSTALPQNKSPRRLRVGITGKFASGKSEVLKVFAESGFFVCSADEIAHDLLLGENPVAEKVLGIFGSGILEKNIPPQRTFSISRKKLGELVFNSGSEMRKLEKIMHPAMKAAMQKVLAGNPVCAVENALLFKMGMEKFFDKIVLVKCSDSVREKNLARRGISLAEAEKIFSFQEAESAPWRAESALEKKVCREIKRGQVPFLRKGAGEKGTCPLFEIENSGGLTALREKTKKLIGEQWGRFLLRQ